MREIINAYRAKKSQILWIGLMWMVAGSVLAIYDWLLLNTDYAVPTERFVFMGDFLTNVIAGGVAGTLVAPAIFYIFAKRARKYGLGVYIALVGLYYSLFIISTFIIAVHIYFSIQLDSSPFSPEVQAEVWQEFFSTSTLRTLLFWFAVADVTAFVIQVADKYGHGFFFDTMLGKYSTPREEARIFMFLDLKSSTTIAEELGHRDYFSFLNEFFADATDAILETDGQVYQYVGDEIVISWTMEKGLRNNNALHCFFKIRERIGRLQDKYKKAYGYVPEFKAGLHFGPVTSGEVGVLKRDIVFSGDVLNTAARIQSECNKLDAEFLASDDLLNKFKKDKKFFFDPVGEIDLRGKSERVAVSKVKRVA